jgi:hypothetical protein
MTTRENKPLPIRMFESLHLGSISERLQAELGRNNPTTSMTPFEVNS